MRDRISDIAMIRLSLFAAALLLSTSALAQTAPSTAPEQQLTIKLPVSAWNTIIQGLQCLPNTMIADIQNQAKSQLPPPDPNALPPGVTAMPPPPAKPAKK